MFFLQVEELLQVVENQILEKKELMQLRLGFGAADKTAKTTKKTDEEEFEKERYVTWDEEEYLKTYFQKERHVMMSNLGEDWKKYLKFPNLPRKKYHVEIVRRDSSEERKRQKELLKAKRKKGISIFRK